MIKAETENFLQIAKVPSGLRSVEQEAWFEVPHRISDSLSPLPMPTDIASA